MENTMKLRVGVVGAARSRRRQPVLTSPLILLAAAAAALGSSSSSVALSFSSSPNNLNNPTNPPSTTNSDHYLNNYLDAVDSPRPRWLTPDPQKPQPEEPPRPWGVQTPPPAESAPWLSDAPTAEVTAAEEAVATEKKEKGREDVLTEAARYLDSHGSAYVETLAEGRKMQQANSAPTSDPPSATDGADNAETSASGTVSRLESLLAARESELAAKNSELAALREEHRAVKAAAADLLRRYYDLAEGLDEVESALAKCADSFPDPDGGGLESYEWLLNR